MDIEMKNQTLSELIKRDKKLGRSGPKKNQKGGAQGKNNANNKNQVPRIRKGQAGGIQKKNRGNGPAQQQQQQQRRPQNQTQKVANNKQQSRVAGQQNIVQRRANLAKKLHIRKEKVNARQGNGNGNGKGNGNLQNLRQKIVPKNGRQPQQQLKVQRKPLRQQQQQQPRALPKQASPQQVTPAAIQVQGTLAQRKLKVRNIDDTAVTHADLQKLFSKCGPLVSASFDKNTFGQYLGSATVVYQRASSSSQAIKDYNGAMLDDRVMKVEYSGALPQSPVAQKGPRLQAPLQQQVPSIRRKTIGRRSNSSNAGAGQGRAAGGRTLNVAGSNKRTSQKNARIASRRR